jgi:hypothetical protein
MLAIVMACFLFFLNAGWPALAGGPACATSESRSIRQVLKSVNVHSLQVLTAKFIFVYLFVQLFYLRKWVPDADLIDFHGFSLVCPDAHLSTDV